MAQSISNLVTAASARDFYNGTQKKNYLGAELFPDTKQLGLEISFLQGRGGVPIQLQAGAFDANAPLRSPIAANNITADMPFFREGVNIKEKDRQQINTYLAAGQEGAVDIVLGNIFGDIAGLIQGGEVAKERMRMQLLSTGSINFTGTEEGVHVNYNYGLDNSQFETLVGTNVWSNAAADPIGDIERWITATGAKRAITNGNTFGLLRRHPTVIDVVGAYFGGGRVSVNNVKDYFKQEYDLTIAVYDESFSPGPGQPAQKFFPDNVFTLLPDGPLGQTVHGTTPEESDLLNKISVADTAIVGAGTAITMIHKPHPVTTETYASLIAMPSFPEAGSVFIATIA